MIVVVVVMMVILTLNKNTFTVAKNKKILIPYNSIQFDTVRYISIQFDPTVIELETSFSLPFGQSFYNNSCRQSL